MRTQHVIMVVIWIFNHLGLTGQCPEITQTILSNYCQPDCLFCSGDRFQITIQGNDLPDNGKIEFYADPNPGFNPYNGQGTRIGSSHITTTNPKCRICPQLLGFMIDACGPEARNEFLVIWTGSGFNTSDFTFDYAFQNNIFGSADADIGPGGCSITNGNPGLIGGCIATPVGNNYLLPPNAIWIVFTSSSASTTYNFSSLCGLTCKLFVSSSTCDRVIGAFSNFDASPGLRIQMMSISGCACSTVAVYSIPGGLTGQGDFWVEGSIVNNGCSTPAFNTPVYDPAPSSVEPFTFNIPASWCDKQYELVGILSPKPDVSCCMQEFTERFTASVSCPQAFPAELEMCETNNGTTVFNLDAATSDVLGNSSGIVDYYKDASGMIKISSPYTSSNATIYARATIGKCHSPLVPINLKVLPLPIAQAAFINQCDDGSGMADFDLTSIESKIKNGKNPASVQFYKDQKKIFPITSPYSSNSDIIYSTIIYNGCESKPVPITLNLFDKPIAYDILLHSCAEQDGKAVFDLTGLIPNIVNNQTEVHVTFYDDDILFNALKSPYRNVTDTIYAVVFNAYCASDPSRIFLIADTLNPPPNVQYRYCDDGQMENTLDLINIKSILQHGDTSISVEWFSDTLLPKKISPTVKTFGMDTIYAKLTKEHCKSKYVTIIPEDIKRPFAKSFTWNVCTVAEDSFNFYLPLIADTINEQSGLAVVFSKDSTFQQLVDGHYKTVRDTLFAAVQDGNCLSISSQIILNVNTSPFLFKQSDTMVCDPYILPPISGTHLTSGASYYLNLRTEENKLQPGDSIRQSSLIIIYDHNEDCAVEDSFLVNIVKPPFAGLDQMVSVCQNGIINLNQYLRNADPGGWYYDPVHSGRWLDSVYNTTGLAGQTVRLLYILNGSSSCPDDTSTLLIHVVKELNAGQDTFVTLCERDSIDLLTLIPTADPGGQFIDVSNSNVLQKTILNASATGSGIYELKYEIGDGISCPRSVSYIKIQVYPAIEITIDSIKNKSSCDFFILPPISGKNTFGRTAYYTLTNGAGTVLHPGDTITENNQFFVYGKDSSYCADEKSFFVHVNHSVNNPSGNITLCPGDSILINNTLYGPNKLTGIERFLYVASNGCDSLVHITIDYFPKAERWIQNTLCHDEFIIANSNRYDANHPNGVEILKAASTLGNCDSIILVNLQFFPEIRSEFVYNLCEGEQINLNGKIYNKNILTGMDTFENANANGCDSFVEIKIKLLPTPTFTYRNTICENDFLIIGNMIFDKTHSGIRDTLKAFASNGCDSIRDIQLQFLPVPVVNYEPILCDNEFVIINGNRYDKNNSSGREVLKNISSTFCDSIININLTLIHSQTTMYSDTLCPGESMIINGQVYDQNHLSGSEKLTSRNGCDSIVVVELYFPPWKSDTISDIYLTPGLQQTIKIYPPFTPTQIQWSPAYGLSCTDCLNPVANPTETTTYSVDLKDEHNCSFTIQITVHIAVQDDLFIPNAFTPNGDNTNDILRAISSNPDLFIFEFSIYDRWGNLFYSEKNKTISKLAGWDGSNMKGDKANPGVYVYYIRMKTTGVHDKKLTGDVSLIR